MGLCLDEPPGIITLAVCLCIGVFVVRQPLQVGRSVVERLIVDVIDVIATARSALYARASGQERFSHQLMHLDAAHFAIAGQRNVLVSAGALQLKNPAVEAVSGLAVPSDA
jgi:hypothetical protein